MSSTINVYQSLAVKEKITNYSSSPELVYSKITTLSLIIRQLEKDGTGIIFCRHESLIKTVQNIVGKKSVSVTDLQQLKLAGKIDHSRLLVVILNGTETVKVSELNQIAASVTRSGVELKWISILQQPVFNQLFKWELKYN
jgi:hypothetical protein